MIAPVKFDFSSYSAAISAIPAIQPQEPSHVSSHAHCDFCDSAIPEQENRSKIAESQESQATVAKNADSLMDQPLPQNRRTSGIASTYDDFLDDRHFCRECTNFRNGYCIKQRFRPVDDIPHRCDDFTGYEDQISQSTINVSQSSEAEYNARGEYFKWLIVKPNGLEFIAAAMPRRTLSETRVLFPDAIEIAPIIGEDYDGEQ